ncbi:hypothetical protein [Skermanella pratensis]|uniref:hypothetical protein n=1 Tax=Skermanella pratensis TaxID=2233999 RepID=UPI001300F28B|nr:hypothetical protein [Skermanella pratensis]
MLEPRNQPEPPAAPRLKTPARRMETALQVLLGMAFLADLAFLAALGLHLSESVEATGLTLAAGCAVLLAAVLIRVTRRIGASDTAGQT